MEVMQPAGNVVGHSQSPSGVNRTLGSVVSGGVIVNFRVCGATYRAVIFFLENIFSIGFFLRLNHV